MRNGLVVGVILVLAGTASAASIDGRPDLDRMAGVYKHRAAPGFDRSAPPGEDILEIVKLSPRAVYFRIHTQDGDHICGIHGVADLTADSLVYSRPHGLGEPCTLKFRASVDGVVPDDVGGGCSRENCGAGADLGFGEDARFRFSEKRPIRYMARLLASREYAEAVNEHQKRP